MNLPDFESEYSALFGAIRKIVPPSMKIYLVGGAVRDILLGRKIRDFDFSVEGLVRPIGKHIANELNGAYYVLDDEREMVRVIIEDELIGKFDVDIAQMTGETIEEDLLERDFTFNAMAIQVGETPVFVDPLNGLQDLEEKKLRMCRPDSLRNDPMRCLRAIRMSLEFGLEMDEELRAAMFEAASHLSDSSMERYRDELFKIVRLYQNGKAVGECLKYGILEHLFPGRDRSEEIDSRWIENTDYFSVLLSGHHKFTKPLDDYALYAASRLGNYKEALKAFFDKPLALYHDRRMLTSFTAVSSTIGGDPDLIRSWCGHLAFSGSETNYVLSSLGAIRHLRGIPNVASYGDVDIYRYFHQFKEGGVAGLILYLAMEYHMEETAGDFKDWCDKVVFVQDMVAAYFTRYMEVISPKPLMSGNDIQELLGIPAGPVIGNIKNSLIEAQIRGSLKTLQEAELFVRKQIE